MEEGVGFEPTELTFASFQDWCLKPDSANLPYGKFSSLQQYLPNCHGIW